MLKWDGHTHTQYCYHGNPAPVEQYIEKAIALGFQRYSITEHPPLPDKWVEDEQLFNELAMSLEELPLYFKEVERCKIKYQDQIEIVSGLELDYLYKHTQFTEQLIEKYASEITDIVYSVHYLPGKDGNNYCIDFTAPYFKEHILNYYGSMEKVVDQYFDHVELAIKHASQFKVRKRIGHLLLIKKFEKDVPAFNEHQIEKRLQMLIPLLKEHNVGVDVNIAGKRVPSFGHAYVPQTFIKQCVAEGIECVYGSDSHKPEQVGLYWDWFESIMRA